MRSFHFGQMIAVLAGFVLVAPVAAQVSAPEAQTSAYQLYGDAPSFSIKVPTVVEMPLPGGFTEREQAAVLDKTTGVFVHNQAFRFVSYKPTEVVATSDIAATNEAMVDGSVTTYAEFDLPARGVGQVQITLRGVRPISSDSLSILLDQYVALPTSIEISADAGGARKIVVARRQISSATVQFPKTTASTWYVSLTYGQPLRIAEIRLNQYDITSESKRAVRFLAYPDRAYRVYFSPDRYAPLASGERPNLLDDKGVLKLPSTAVFLSNPVYKLVDTDGDGVPDLKDNCVQVANSDQEDLDGNSRGDVCDDFDHDGLLNAKDNCSMITNAAQTDMDSDGIGDACDGEESRVTEKYVWLPWLGMGFAGAVLIVLFALVAKSMKKDGNLPPQ